MKLNRNELKKMIAEEVGRLNEWTGDEMESAGDDMAQQYINFIVAVQEAARESLEDIERGTEPYEAAVQSRFNTLVQGYTKEEFYDFYFG